LLPVLIIFGVTACQLPPFDEELSLALITAKKMRLETEIGPIHFQDNFQPDADYFYVPSNVTLRDGFIVSRMGNRYGLVHFSPDAGTPPEYWTDSTWDRWVWSGNAEQLASQFYPFGIRNKESILVYGITEGGQTGIVLQGIEYSGSIVDFSSLSPLALAGSVDSTVETTIGFEAVTPPSATATDQELHLLVLDGSSGKYYEVSNTVNASSGATSTALAIRPDPGGTPIQAIPAPLPPFSISQAAYHYDAARDRSYLSVWDPGTNQFRNYVWYENPSVPGELVPEELPVRTRIARLLTNGDLYGVNNQSGMVFRPDGELKYRFPLGELRFVFEYWDPGRGEFRCAFSLLSQDFVGNDGGEQLYARVYSIPTNELDKLD